MNINDCFNGSVLLTMLMLYLGSLNGNEAPLLAEALKMNRSLTQLELQSTLFMQPHFLSCFQRSDIRMLLTLVRLPPQR